MTPKQQANFRLTREAHRLLKVLAQKLGVSQAGVIETALRRLADQEQVKRRS